MKIDKNLLIEEIALAIKDCFELKEIKAVSPKITLEFNNGQVFELTVTEKE